MEIIGLIRTETDPPGVDRARWIEVIRDHANLALMQRRESINPFTKEPLIFEPLDIARVVIDGSDVGKMTWAKNGKRGANAIQVFGDLEKVVPVAREVALALGAYFDSDPFGLLTGSQRLVAQVWRSISIYDGSETFLAQFRAISLEVGHLYAAHWCQSEVCNGGFHQFFANDTGVLAPESLAAFHALKLSEWARVLEEAMAFFGEPYPRDRHERLAKLGKFVGGKEEEGDPFVILNKAFYHWLREHRGGFENASDEYAKAIKSN